ncbi:hypothetical protein RRG08_006171 [Elysia crispata]|uniref:EGF-like domain-containing protein n=1 Tax=Elysia crispata TaxID=231223 RepID=A0AAE1EEU0_9GAST|nr:hypothetical protein RRG08_006171 [Elysia crispata]
MAFKEKGVRLLVLETFTDRVVPLSAVSIATDGIDYATIKEIVFLGVCSPFCSGGKQFCENINGDCVFNCSVGHYGDICDIVCTATTHTVNCSERCDPTCGRPQNVCGILNTTCISGCVDGYQGDRCEFAVHNEREEQTEKLPTINDFYAAIGGLFVIFVGFTACTIMGTKLREDVSDSGFETDLVGSSQYWQSEVLGDTGAFFEPSDVQMSQYTSQGE